MESVTRVVDDYLVKQTFTENASLEKFTQKADVLGQLESVFNEPSETGLNNKLTEFYESWKYLGNNPELTTSKTMVSQQAQTLTDTVSHMGAQLDTLQEGTVQAISKKSLGLQHESRATGSNQHANFFRGHKRRNAEYLIGSAGSIGGGTLRHHFGGSEDGCLPTDIHQY